MTDRPTHIQTPTSAPFWDAIQRRELLLQRCMECGTWQHYPREMCATCWSDRLEWATPGRLGVVWSYTVIHRAGHPAWADQTPYVVAIVELPEGPRLVANIVDAAGADIRVGMPVELVVRHTAGQTLLQATPRSGQPVRR
jgi:uncharacterized protein